MKAMGEAERSIAVKRKIAVTKPMSREESPSEIYTPKRRKSDTSTQEVSPPPYIPSRKESSFRSGNSAQESLRRQGSSKEDARQLLDRKEYSRVLLPARERQELISRSRRIELFQKLGLDRQEASNDRDRRVKEEGGEFVKKEEERAKRGIDVVRNFKITAHIAPSARLSDVVKERLTKAVKEKGRTLQVLLPSLTSSKRGTVASRLGKVVVQRRSSLEREERSSELKDKSETMSSLSTRSQQLGSRRLALSLFGKEVVKKQCEAAVLSVKSVGIRKYEQNQQSDSRVVESQELSEEEEKEQSEEKSPLGFVPPASDEKSVSDSPEKDSEDLDEMLKDDLEEDLLHETLTDEFTLDLEDDEDLIKVIGQLEEKDTLSVGEEGQAGRGKGTRFIVTLDGVDERRFEGKRETEFSDVNRLLGYDSSVQPSSLSLPLKASSTPMPIDQALFLQPHDASKGVPVLKSAPPKIQPFSISLKDSDDEFEEKVDAKVFYHHAMQAVSKPIALAESGEELTALQKSKMNERCKFWPACAAGADCKFHHPTSYCKTFPNCKFGDKCLFIHPNCKFDSKCTRVDCPFTHTSRRPALTAAPQPFKSPVGPPATQPYYPQYIPFSGGPSQSSTVCKFFPNCHNVSCPFVHPKPCRFGLSCQSPGCPFSHPSAPTKDKLKWTAQTEQSHQVKEAMMTTLLSPPPSSAKPRLSAQSTATVSSTSV